MRWEDGTAVGVLGVLKSVSMKAKGEVGNVGSWVREKGVDGMGEGWS
jgi:hypothetical protein